MTHTINPTGEQAPRPPAPTPEEQRASVARLLLVIAAVVGLSLATGTFSTVAVVVAILMMVMLHELGHFATAKWAGMKVTEFFVGFGPRLWSVRKGETEYGVKGVPLGGYVKIIGMSNLEQVDPADEPRTYRQKSFPRRMSVALAGSTMHFLIAFVLLFVLLVAIGVPRSDNWVIGGLTRLRTGESPAQEAGLRLGDRIVSVDGRAARDFDEFRRYLRANPGETVNLVVERDGERVTLRPTLASRNPEGERVGFLGASPDYPLVTVNPVTAAGRSAETVGRLVWAAGDALASFFTPSSLRDYTDQITGEERPGTETGDDNRFLSPVGAVRIASQAADTGMFEVLELLIAINVFVGLFNLIPLLPLDGGHVAIAIYERIRSRAGRRYHADVSRLLPLTAAVVAVLITLGVTSLWLDIVRPLDNPFQ